FEHRIYRWRIALLLWFLKLMVHNAWILYQAVRKKKVPLFTFIKKLARQMAPIRKISEDLNEHELVSLKKSKHCRICTMMGKKSSCTMFCKECGVPMHSWHSECEHRAVFTNNFEILRHRNYHYEENISNLQQPETED